jgi:hypothetical protein
MSSEQSWFTKPRFSLRGIMLMVLLCALIVCARTQPGFIRSFGLLALVSGPLVMVYVVLHADRALPFLGGPSCPVCGERKLGRVAVVSFGPRFYRCTACGARCKIAFLSGHLREVKSALDLSRFEPKAQLGPWDVEEWDDPDGPQDVKTIASLVRNQRRRQPPPSSE